MKYGLKPKKYHPLDSRFEFHKTFGSISPLNLPDEYSCDNGQTMPDQNADNAPTECSAYTVTDIAFDEDGQEYSHDYQYMKALQIGRYPVTATGCDLKSAFKVPCTFGLLAKAKAPFSSLDQGQFYAADQNNWPLTYDLAAAKNIKPAYWGITGPYDFFDNIRSAMWIAREEKRSIGLGINWYPSFEECGTDGILSEIPSGEPGGHSPKVSGWTAKNTAGNFIRGGEIFLKVKSWQGFNYGDKGWCYISRPLISMLMDQWGADAQMLAKIDDGTLSTLLNRKATLLEVLIAFYYNLRTALTH